MKKLILIFTCLILKANDVEIYNNSPRVVRLRFKAGITNNLLLPVDQETLIAPHSRLIFSSLPIKSISKRGVELSTTKLISVTTLGKEYSLRRRSKIFIHYDSQVRTRT